MAKAMEFLLIGSGPQLVASAEVLLSRGHVVRGIVSGCPQVASWAQRKAIPRLGSAPAEEQASWLRERGGDYLLSIVNHAIATPAMLAAARHGAINYHDSPLPEYAGFNATAWAVMEQRRTHAVTWHEMTASVDGGRILLQRAFEIGDDDTAFTLAAKCAEEGVSSFAALLEQLERGAVSGTPQGPQRSFHHRSDRPDAAVLDLAQPGAVLGALVRGLHFGPDDSWMCRPKLRLPGGFVALGEVRLDNTRETVPGTVLSLGERSLEVAVSGGVLAISEITTLDGAPLSAAQLGALGAEVGRVLPPLEPSERERLRTHDAVVTKSERFWVERLRTLHAPALLGLARVASAGKVSVLARKLPESAPSDTRVATLLAAFAAYLGRVAEEPGPIDLGLDKPLSGVLGALYARSAPLRVEVDRSAPYSALRAQLVQELATQQKRGTYARDAVQRYASLRSLSREHFALPVAVSLEPGAPRLVEGSALTLAIAPDGASYAWVHDEAALSPDAARALAERVEVLLEAALESPEAPIGKLPLLPPPERALLLHTFQDTARPYERDRCVHELFEAQAARTPDAVALVFRDQTLRYAELDQRANQLAHRLRAAGVGPDTRVGICVERSLEMVIGLLGILKAGGAYVPLDPVYPRDRLEMMLEDARAKVLVTQRHLAERLPPHGAPCVCVDALPALETVPAEERASPRAGTTPSHLAYVIFTSGSTGRPKGVMVEHRNVCNFFTGMDEVLGGGPGVWLAVTSISFDISVLELFWTLTRGFEVVIQEESDKSSLARRSEPPVSASSTPMGFGLFYFAADSGSAVPGAAYKLLIEGAKFADAHDFTAIWTPERHFHAFGGLYPNPALTTAALATITERVQLRAGSVVLPLHHPLRVAEDWAVLDQLSGGRIGLSFASGWHANDFAFFPENYERRREIMLEHLETVRKLWRGEAIPVQNGQGQPVEVRTLPRPLQENPPVWVASAGSTATFELAGRLGLNVLTNMLGQDLADLRAKFAAYRDARRASGHPGEGIVSVMLHTFVCDETERARALARKPFSDYLASSFDLVKVAPWMFPAFKQPSRGAAQDPTFDPSSFTAEDMAALLDHAFDRYFDTAGLFGTPERALSMIEQLKSIGANEVACLIDFGVAPEVVLESLPQLDRLRQLSNPAPRALVQVVAPDAAQREYSIAHQLRARRVTHLQCTPSMARMLLSDPDARAALGPLEKLMLGGEALPTDLVEQLVPLVSGDLVNMYGPTETTIWSTTAPVGKQGEPITIGRPIANTVVRLLDDDRQLVPIGVAGELCIGGAGVVRGYLDLPELTAARFIEDPCAPGERLYRTGDLARFRADGALEFLGRLDHQVKVNGYRIELGEIESGLARHPAVRQAVVVARSDESGARLVGYVVPDASAIESESGEERVGHWQSLWDETYRQSGEHATHDPRFNIAGWRDSYTGEPIPAPAMREWLDATVARILALAPRRVLEIGCGTGMILYRVLPHVEHYSAIDLSAHALESIRQELTAAERAKVTLLQKPAHALDEIAPRSHDLVVINSVAQYFPDADYLVDVLRRASERVADGGHLFLGDVRSLGHLEAFHTVVELHRAPPHARAAEITKQVARRVAEERELVLDPGFFDLCVRELPRLGGCEIALKRGAVHDEMSCFRYDVVLRVGSAAPEAALPAPSRTLATLAAVEQALAEEPPVLVLEELSNARLASLARVQKALREEADVRIERLRALHAQSVDDAIDPEALYRIDPRYDVDLRWAASGDPYRFDALLRHKQTGPRGVWARADRASGLTRAQLANRPAQRAGGADALVSQLRAQLRAFLPEFMIPSTFVLLESFPLTPNGKIDRKALPAPEAPKAARTAYVAPGSGLEQQIADVWKEMLNVERIGLRDNIFDLGANSLLTVQASNRLSARLGRKVSLVSMFRFPTVEALAAHLGGDKPSAQADKREQERAARRVDAAERRRQARAERSTRGS